MKNNNPVAIWTPGHLATPLKDIRLFSWLQKIGCDIYNNDLHLLRSSPKYQIIVSDDFQSFRRFDKYFLMKKMKYQLTGDYKKDKIHIKSKLYTTPSSHVKCHTLDLYSFYQNETTKSLQQIALEEDRKLWNDDKIISVLKKHLPQYLSQYKETRKLIFRLYLATFIILYTKGGFVVAPNRHLRKKPAQNALFITFKDEGLSLAETSVLGAPKNHPFFLDWLEHLFESFTQIGSDTHLEKKYISRIIDGSWLGRFFCDSRYYLEYNFPSICMVDPFTPDHGLKSKCQDLEVCDLIAYEDYVLPEIDTACQTDDFDLRFIFVILCIFLVVLIVLYLSNEVNPELGVDLGAKEGLNGLAGQSKNLDFGFKGVSWH